MRPDEPQQTPQSTASANDAATDIIRNQVASAYNTQQGNFTTEALVVENTDQTTATEQEVRQPTPEDWKNYHSAWQSYYQTYYERYYTHHLRKAHQDMQARTGLAAEQSPVASGTQQPEYVAALDDSLDKDTALSELRNSLRNSVQTKAETVRKSRHFVPILSAIVVMMLFGFLQYNQILIANVKAYVSPGNVNPQNIIVNPSTSVTVDPKSTTLAIPKINVEVPVNYNAKNDYDSQMAAMKNGLAYFGVPGANSKPGQVGNTPIAGHSSNDVFDRGDYKFIFAQLDKLKKGDTIYANYKGTRYTYVVTKKAVVLPSQVNELVYKTDKPMMTLITCTPLGTALKRLLVTAEQVNPSPVNADTAPTNDSNNAEAVSIPGTEPTALERLFGRD